MKCAYCDTETKQTLKVSDTQYSMAEGVKQFRAAAVYVPVCAQHKAQLESNMTYRPDGRVGPPIKQRLDMVGQFTIDDYLR
jgi:hypothetical protein